MRMSNRFVGGVIAGISACAFWALACTPCARGDFPAEQYLARGYFRSPVFSRDGTRVLTTSGSSSTGVPAVAQLWEVHTGKLLKQFTGHRATIHSIAFSVDETRVLTAAGNNYVVGPQDPTARVWDTDSGKEVAVLRPGGTYVYSAQFSPDDDEVLTAYRDTSSSGMPDGVVVWDLKTQKIRLTIAGITEFSKPTRTFEPVRFSPDGRLLAGLTDDGTQINLWNAKTGELVWHQEGDLRDAEGTDRHGFGLLQFSGDGKLLLAVCSDDTARIWDTRMAQSVGVFASTEGSILTATFCGDGGNVMTATRDGTARLWERATGELVRRFQHEGPVAELAASRDGKRMIAKWRRLKEDTKRQVWYCSLWDIASGAEIKRFELGSGPHRGLTLSPDGRRILANLDVSKVYLLDAETGEVLHHYK